ncbi:hypothetical protein P7C70_g4445, partial [Phenoliferia sp. Uapishka_3]
MRHGRMHGKPHVLYFSKLQSLAFLLDIHVLVMSFAGYFKSWSGCKAFLDGLLCGWCPLYSDLKVDSNVDLKGRNVIVTGANSGIGLECARKLASFGANVTLACRDASRAKKAMDDLIASTSNTNIEVMQLDVSNFASIRAFVAAWGSKPIDILLNNAGQPPARYLITEDGLEQSYVANFLSQVMLTELLLPFMAPNCRVVMVSSITNYTGLIDVNDLDKSKYISNSLKLKPGDAMPPTSLVTLYADAKLAQVVYTRALQQHLDASSTYAPRNIVVHAVHPGVVKTPLWGKSHGAAAKYNGIVDKVVSSANLIGITPEQGACTPVWAATNPELR